MTNDVPQHLIVTLALYLEGGGNKFVDTEEIAMRSHSIAPGRFSWRKYPEQINLELVRVFLSDAKKPDKGALVTGSGRKGWSLTSAGLRWVQSEGLSLVGSDELKSGKIKRSGSIDHVRRSRELQRIRASDAWQKWDQGVEEITSSEAKQVFRVDSYSQGEMLKLKIDRTQKSFIDDKETSEFLQKMRDIVLAGE